MATIPFRDLFASGMQTFVPAHFPTNLANGQCSLKHEFGFQTALDHATSQDVSTILPNVEIIGSKAVAAFGYSHSFKIKYGDPKLDTGHHLHIHMTGSHITHASVKANHNGPASYTLTPAEIRTAENAISEAIRT